MVVAVIVVVLVAVPVMCCNAGVMSRKSLEEQLLDKLIVIKLLSVSDDDVCQVTLPLCDHNQLHIPQLARL